MLYEYYTLDSRTKYIYNCVILVLSSIITFQCTFKLFFRRFLMNTGGNVVPKYLQLILGEHFLRYSTKRLNNILDDLIMHYEYSKYAAQRFRSEENLELYRYLRASLCKILISSFAHKMDFAHNFSVDFF